MPKKKNNENNDQLKNNGLFMFSPADDDDTEDLSPEKGKASFDVIMPLDYNEIDDSDGLHMESKTEDIVVMKSSDTDNNLHTNESIEDRVTAADNPTENDIKTPKNIPAKKKENKQKDTEKISKPEKTQKEKPEKAKTVETAKKEPKAPKSSSSFILTITLKLVLICTVVAVLIAGVYQMTAPIIEKNETVKKQNALKEIFPSMTSYEEVPCDADGINELYLVRDDTRISGVLGYCASVSPKGYGGEISLMIGIDPDKSIKDIKVLSHSETPGYGADLLNAEYITNNSGYVGFDGDLAVLGDDVDTYSGATRTSKALNTGVNNALAVYEQYILPNIDTKLAAVETAYSWVTEEHRAVKSAFDGHSFDEIYCIKVVDPAAGEVNGGYAAVVTVTNETGSAKLLVTTWFRMINSIEVLESSGDGFEGLAIDKEQISEIKRHINSGITPEGEIFSDEGYAVYEKTSEVLAFYPAYLDLIKASEGGAANE